MSAFYIPAELIDSEWSEWRITDSVNLENLTMQKMDIGHDAVVYGLMIDEQTNGKVSYALKSFNIKRGQADIIVYGASNY